MNAFRKSRIQIMMFFVAIILMLVVCIAISTKDITNSAQAEALEAYDLKGAESSVKQIDDVGNLKDKYLTIFSENGDMEDIEVDPELLDDKAPNTRANFNVHSIINSGRPNDESVVITIMGDGFTSSEQTAFINQATTVANGILGTYPFSQFADYFNIYAVEVHSNESGVSRDYTYNDAIVDNYFGSTFWHDGNTARLLYVTKSSRVRALIQPHNDMTIVLANSSSYGGGGGEFAVVSGHQSASRITVHELGHSFGKLKDEYWWEPGAAEAPNMTQNSDPNTVKWSGFIGYNNVGVYPHTPSGVGATWYKPHQNCLMGTSGSTFFCPVCENELYNRLYSIASKITVFNNFGYEGSTYYWKGAVRMEFNPIYNRFTTFNTLIIEDESVLNFELLTASSNNAFSTINGTVNFELKNGSGEVLQTHTSTVKVNLVNSVEITGITFTIDTSNLENDIYELKMTSSFERAFWTEEDTQIYTFIVNHPTRIISDFGYLSSWYKWKGNVILNNNYLYLYGKNASNQMIVNRKTTLNFAVGTDFAFNAVSNITSNMTIVLRDSQGNIININGKSPHNATSTVGLVSNVSFSGRTFSIYTADLPNDTYTLTLNNTSTRSGTTYTQTKTFTFEVNVPDSCVAEGSLITLADGSRVAVEDLTGDEQLLVWNLFTGEFDTAPILFIDSDPAQLYELINLSFSDGTVVKVIDEHGFWNVDLNEYVFLRRDAAKYIGNRFNKQTTDENGNLIWTAVQLTGVELTSEQTRAYSPVTYGHLCYYVNGMLSMPGATTGLINIFEVDPDTMRIDEAAYLADIAEYGLFTYEEFAELVPVPEEIFNAFGGQYLKVAMGKGLIDTDGLVELVERYAEFFDMETPNENPDNQNNENGGNNGNHYGHSNGNNGNHNGHGKGNNGRGKR